MHGPRYWRGKNFRILEPVLACRAPESIKVFALQVVLAEQACVFGAEIRLLWYRP